MLLRLTSVLSAVLILCSILVIGAARLNADDEAYFLSYAASSGNGGVLYRINPDGSGRTGILSLSPRTSAIGWSPRGMTLVAADVSVNPSGATVQRLRWDGWMRRSLMEFSNPPIDVTWMPDGGSLLVEMSRFPGNAMSLYHVKADDGVSDWIRDASGTGARVSPDGIWLAYNHSEIGSRINIELLRADGREEHPLTNQAFDDFVIAWSPSGERILFLRTFAGTNATLYDVRPDGTDLREMLPNDGDWRPQQAAYSPDGRWIALSHYHNSRFELAVIPADGGAPRFLSASANYDLSPAWSPDSAWIAFIRRESFASAVYRIRPDGTDLQRLTDFAGDLAQPMWSPPYGRTWQPLAALMAAGALLLPAARRVNSRK